MNRSKDIKAAFQHFVDREYDKLVNYTRKNYRDYYAEADPQDIVQDIALNIYNKINLDYPIQNITAYFYQSIKNKINDLIRKKKHEISQEYNFKLNINYQLFIIIS